MSVKRSLIGVLSAVTLVAALFACNSEPKEQQVVVEHNKMSLSAEEQRIAALNDELEVAMKKVAANPTMDILHRKAAEILLKLSRPEAAFREAKEAVSIDSTVAENWLVFGKMSFAVDHFYSAQEAFKRCLEINPENADCITQLAEFYLLRKDYAKAIEYANKSLRIDQYLYRPYYIKGWAYMEAGDSAKAASSYRTAVELNPEFYEGYIMLGNMYYKANHPLAEEYFKTALTIQPESLEALYFLATFYQQQDSIALAMQTYDEILRIDSTFFNAYYNKGYILLTQTTEFDSAAYYFEKSLIYNPESSNAYYNLGLAKEEQGMNKAAKVAYQKALDKDATNSLAKEALKRK